MAFGLRKTPEPEVNQRVMDAAKLLRIEHMLERKPAALSGGQRQRVTTGGAPSDLQRQYLSTVLNAKAPSIDIVNPAQYFGAGWLEPLNAYVGEPAVALKPYLPVYAASNVIDGKIAAMPAFADSMFMYYRKDLLEKDKLPEPKTWDELSASAKGLATWLGMVDAGVIEKNVAEVKTPDTVNEFKAGGVVFAVNWGFASERFKDDMVKSVPWFKDAANVVIADKRRPASKDRGQVSDIIRTTTSAVLARTKTPDEGVNDIEARL